MMRNLLRRYACYALASVDLGFPFTDPRDAPTVRLPWRRSVLRRRRVFPEAMIDKGENPLGVQGLEPWTHGLKGRCSAN